MFASVFVVSSIKAAFKALPFVAHLVFTSTALVVVLNNFSSVVSVVSLELGGSEDDDNHSEDELNELHFINIK